MSMNMSLIPLYKNRIYVPESSNTGFYYCPSCGKELTNIDGESLIDSPNYPRIAYCTGSNSCELEVSYQSVMVAIERDQRGWGVDKNKPRTLVSLYVDGKELCYAYIEETDFEDSVDVAYLSLSYIHSEYENEETAKIISDFAKWIRFDWETCEKQGEFPTLVRLVGVTCDKRKDWRNQYSYWIALPNAVDIKAKHLAREFTYKEIKA